ncbi:hypothetical protein [Chryseolinea lacunae]|uniref:DUF2383 domain-containing protein n=1 Tax=Chryseolinea lacunae TaxID=2801331 RepID=A0ABS1KUN6_9BACT|nr:hypothetical protein [Chryseolinea lacunae]MBL0743018.1 hypothetical protein [Chryseolinea lacunae]
MEKKILGSQTPADSSARRPVSDKIGDDALQTWQSYHVITEQWKSDLQFEKDEIDFFRKLISEHFARFMDTAHAEKSRTLTADLAKLEKQRVDLQGRIVEHGGQMLKIVQNPFQYVDELLYKHNHEELENEMMTFLKSHRLLKRTFMQIAEEILRTEKIMHMLSGK